MIASTRGSREFGGQARFARRGPLDRDSRIPADTRAQAGIHGIREMRKVMATPVRGHQDSGAEPRKGWGNASYHAAQAETATVSAFKRA